VHGSQAYGLATPTSDVDVKGVLVGPAGWYHGFVGGPEQIELGPDHVRFEIRKYFRLACAANPTVLELLWTPPECHLHVTAAGELLLAARERFLSQRVKDSFCGYAMSQLGRIKTHRKWVMTPPQRAPLRADFGLPERPPISRDQLGAVEAMLGDGRLEQVDLTTNFLDLLERERRYKAEQLVAVVASGRVLVRRDDRDELLGIKSGALSYDELMAAAAGLAAQVQAAAPGSPLPAEPDEAGLDRLCAELVDAVLRGR